MSRYISRYQLTAGQAAKRFSDIEQLAIPLNLTGRHLLPEFELLCGGLKKIFLCSTQDKEILLQFLALGEAHAAIHYPSTLAHVKGINAKLPWGDTTCPATMLTGLAGTGKSELLKALNRLLGNESFLDLPGHDRVPLVPGWFMNVKEGSSPNSLLLPWIEQKKVVSKCNKVDSTEEYQRKDLNLPRLAELSRRVAFRDGVCIISIDEFQFISKSTSANSLATNLLLRLLAIGPRLIFGANYSLAHRLDARGQEDRQRLLARRIYLKPENLCSPDGIRLLKEYFKILPMDFTLDAIAVAQQVQDYTFGIKRLVVDLLAISWVHAKKSGGVKANVTTDDLRCAFLSRDFCANRVDVEILQRQEIEKRQIRRDLWDPFFSEQQDNVFEVVPAISAFEKRVEERRLDSFLTPNERLGFDAIKKLVGATPKEANVVPMNPLKRSKQGLADALRLLND
ncbi:hypothetical protein Rfer_1053 [Rhodoferax ferrireducens T118]|uniref:ORC1/DEAH AAA+ ATPase domain-containing protein n=1 Tax=Albidiferax ferrireducens (strain ATCC BAA-621 / DSM 15236 / T118) TaxID=338969 RepID=Q21ZK9_ALBFT|nr:ATP-binding protein [Rhodoferax ferrireducens]ABD68794.1 hypothetical protein Rfer_1053 [Rhodoferax ferrireducens T118]